MGLLCFLFNLLKFCVISVWLFGEIIFFKLGIKVLFFIDLVVFVVMFLLYIFCFFYIFCGLEDNEVMICLGIFLFFFCEGIFLESWLVSKYSFVFDSFCRLL